MQKPETPQKANMNLRLSAELIAALDEEQLRLRGLPGSTRRATTIGVVIEGLLRKALNLPPLKQEGLAAIAGQPGQHHRHQRRK